MSRDHYSFNTFVRGHHVYKDEWTPTVGKSLNCVREPLNEKDKNTVAVMQDDKVVGHIPLSYSRCVSQFGNQLKFCNMQGDWKESKSRWWLWSRSALPVFI